MADSLTHSVIVISNVEFNYHYQSVCPVQIDWFKKDLLLGFKGFLIFIYHALLIKYNSGQVWSHVFESSFCFSSTSLFFICVTCSFHFSPMHILTNRLCVTGRKWKVFPSVRRTERAASFSLGYIQAVLKIQLNPQLKISLFLLHTYDVWLKISEP